MSYNVVLSREAKVTALLRVDLVGLMKMKFVPNKGLAIEADDFLWGMRSEKNIQRLVDAQDWTIKPEHDFFVDQ